MSEDRWTKHQATVARAYERLKGKQALLETWEAREDVDADYVRELKKQIHTTKLRLLAMRPVGEQK